MVLPKWEFSERESLPPSATEYLQMSSPPILLDRAGSRYCVRRGHLSLDMHIFRHAQREMTVAAAWAACTAAQQRGDRLGLLLAAARLECGLSDRWSAQVGGVDDESPRRQA